MPEIGIELPLAELYDGLNFSSSDAGLREDGGAGRWTRRYSATNGQPTWLNGRTVSAGAKVESTLQ